MSEISGISASTFVRAARGLVLASLAAGAVAGCGGTGSDGEAAPAGPRIESPELGIAIAALPAGFEVVGTEAGVLTLRHETGGTLELSAEAPEIGGVNLVESVRQHKASIEARPGGEYKGQQELMTANLGTAYYSRGLFDDGGAVREEAAVFLLHPTGDRQLTVVYRYPSGDDSQSRVQDQLFAVVGELEDFGTPAETPAPASEAPEEGTGSEDLSGDG